MAREKSDSLYQLVKSLSKNEKRYFRLFSSRSNTKAKKTLQLFDTLNLQDEFDDQTIMDTNPDFNPSQLSNMKAELYKELLHALRLYHEGKNIGLKIRQHIDFAQVLTDRCLYKQANEQLKKAKKYAEKHNNLELLLEISRIEKGIISHLIDSNNEKRVNKIIAEVSNINEKINRVNQMTNLEARLNSLYKKVGFIRDRRDHDTFKQYFEKNLANINEKHLSPLEKMHLYNLYIGYYFFIQDFEHGHQEAKKLVSLFDENPELIVSKTDLYIQALNKLSISESKLSLYDEFVETVRKLQDIPKVPGIVLNDDIRARLYKYYYLHEINRFFMLGEFKAGVKMVSYLTDELDNFIDRLDQHAQIIFYYKIACMYFGDGNYKQTLVWLNKIINQPDVDIRRDIHCFARILNLVTHFEIGNMDVIDYYIRSTYRFLSKKYDLRLFQKYILSFLRNVNKGQTSGELRKEFEKLHSQLLTLQNKPYERRAFIYFDIISWLESKTENRTVGEIIREKALQRIKSKTEFTVPENPQDMALHHQ